MGCICLCFVVFCCCSVPGSFANEPVLMVLLMTSAWWRHQMETFSALLAICAGNSPVTGEFPAQRPVTQSFDGFFDLHLNKRLSQQSWGWWFETLSTHYDVTANAGALGSRSYPSETRPNFKSKTRLLIGYFTIDQSFRNFAQRTAISLPYSM